MLTVQSTRRVWVAVTLALLFMLSIPAACSKADPGPDKDAFYLAMRDAIGEDKIDLFEQGGLDVATIDKVVREYSDCIYGEVQDDPEKIDIIMGSEQTKQWNLLTKYSDTCDQSLVQENPSTTEGTTDDDE